MPLRGELVWRLCRERISMGRGMRNRADSWDRRGLAFAANACVFSGRSGRSPSGPDRRPDSGTGYLRERRTGTRATRGHRVDDLHSDLRQSQGPAGASGGGCGRDIPRRLIPVSVDGRRVWSGLGHGRQDANRNGTTTVLVTAGMFGAMALFGSTTKRSLAGVGQFLCMGLIGVVLASLVGIFWHNDALQFLSLLRLFGTRRE